VSARFLLISRVAGFVVALGWLCVLIWWGLQWQRFDARFGLAVGVVLGMALSVFVGQRVARELAAGDAAQTRAQTDLVELNHRLEQMVGERTATLQRLYVNLQAEMAERKTSEQALRTALDLLEYSQTAAKVGGWQLDVATGHLYWTAETYRIHETSPAEFNPTVEAGVGYFLPASRQRITEALQAAMERGEGYALELETLTTKGTLIDVFTTCTVTMVEGKAVKLTGIFQDVTERKAAERAMLASNAELARSNADLEQFAYVASHDLQEPLRSISSSVQLLQRRYAGALDARADEFIAHAVGGVQRMQLVIDDLLAYSRIGAAPRVMQVIDMNAALQVARANLSEAIATSHALISHDELPNLMANPIQIAQLFQNLVGNALKFRGGKPAMVHVGARQDAGEWVISVADQGIGIEPQYFERIFKLFQRLHTRTEYPGTGIGLTICQKIVERHGGRIWVESTLGQGTTFYFTLPVAATVLSANSIV